MLGGFARHRPSWLSGVNRTSRAAVIVVMSVALIAAVAAVAAAQPPTGEGRTDVIVRLTTGSDPDAEARGAERDGARTKHVYRNVFPGFAANVPEQAMQGLRRNPRVESIEADGVVTASGTQSPVVWGLDRIDQRPLPVDGSYRYPGDGAGVSAYVIDTGISPGHVDFGGRVRSGYTAINDGKGTVDCKGHGTHVAGTLAGATYGVAKSAVPVAVRVLDCGGSGPTSGVIAGVDWVAGDHSGGAPAVANMSLGGPVSASLDTAVAALINDGVTVALSAGNDNGADACSKSPARVASGLTVGATDRTDARAGFSNIGSCLDLFAPGVGILSDWYTSSTATATLNGTSMAAPHVAGAAAVLLSQQSTLSPATVASRLLNATTPDVVTAAGTGSPDRLLFVDNSVPVSVATPAAQAGTVNTATSLQMSATGGTTPYTWTATGLPTGLSIDPSTGKIAGTPTTAGPYSVTVTAKDALEATGTTSFSWSINASVTPVTVTDPGSRTGTVGTATTLDVTASGGTAPYTWTATGLPAGLSISSSTGKIAGTPTTAGSSSVTVTATDAAGATGTTSFTWTINPAAGCAGQKVLNPDFESGQASWTATTGVIGQHGTRQPARSGTWAAWLAGNGVARTETLSQSVTIPAGCTTYTLSFWLHVDTAETTIFSRNDRLTVTLGSSTMAEYSNLNRGSGYVQRKFNVASFAGTTVTFKFSATENSSRQTSFVVDDTAITVS